MIVEVVHSINGTTHTHRFTGKNISRQLEGEVATIIFKDDTGRDNLGRRVLFAQYSHAFYVITYDED